MPISEPGKILHVKDLEELTKTLNFIHSDIYSLFDKVFGYGGKTLTPGGLAIPDGSYITLANTGLHLQSLATAYELIIKPGSTLTADRTLTLTTGDSDRTIVLSGNTVLDNWFDQSVKIAAGPTFDHLHLTTTIMCAGLTDGHIPYHNTDALGLDDSNIWTDGTNLGIGMDSANNLIQVLDLINFDNTLLSTSLGYEAGKVNANVNNVFIGYGAGKTATNCKDSVFIGANSGINVTTVGTGCIGIGSAALSGRIGFGLGQGNIAIGYQALMATIGYFNIAIGHQALLNIFSGDNNIGIGAKSLYTQLNGDGCVALGYHAGYYETASNKLFIDNAQRASEADGRAKALIYGIFAAATANQYLYLNAHVTIAETLTLSGGLTVPTLKVTTGAALGSILVSDADGDLTYIADVAAGSYLRSGGVATNPLWSTLTLPNTATAFKLAAYTATDVMTELAAVGATGEYLAGATGAIPVWATLNQAAVAGLTTGDSPLFAGLTLTADLPISEGGTGQSTAQGGINALTSVAEATNEHVLTKDTATGNAIFKIASKGIFPGIITRDGDNYISEIALTGGFTYTITRDVNKFITNITNSVNTWAFTRDGNNRITSWSI